MLHKSDYVWRQGLKIKISEQHERFRNKTQYGSRSLTKAEIAEQYPEAKILELCRQAKVNDDWAMKHWFGKKTLNLYQKEP